MGILKLGLDGHYYKSLEEQPDFRFVGGVHMGAGVGLLITPDTRVQGEMKFNINPGFSLYFGVGVSKSF